MTVVNINGRTYNVPDGNVSVINNKIYCNGKLYVSGDDRENSPCNITITGDNISVKTTSGNVIVNGNAGNIITTSGDINVKGDVIGNCKTTSGDINAKQVFNEKVENTYRNNTGVYYSIWRQIIDKILIFFNIS